MGIDALTGMEWNGMWGAREPPFGMFCDGGWVFVLPIAFGNTDLAGTARAGVAD